jgi:hypothetical protein
MAEANPTERKMLGITSGEFFKIFVSGAVGGAVALICSALTQLTPEQGLYLALGVIFLISLALILFRGKATAQSKIIGPDQKPYEHTASPLLRRVGIVFCVLSLCAIGLWYRFGSTLVPLASITDFEMSDIRYTYGPVFKGRVIVPNEFYQKEEDGDCILATPCVLLTLAITDFRARTVQIQSLEFQVKPIPFKYWHPRKGVYPINAIVPNRFAATLEPKTETVKARIL